MHLSSCFVSFFFISWIIKSYFIYYLFCNLNKFIQIAAAIIRIYLATYQIIFSTCMHLIHFFFFRNTLMDDIWFCKNYICKHIFLNLISILGLIQIIFLWFGFEINNRSYLLRYASACFGCSSNIKLARGPRQGHYWEKIKKKTYVSSHVPVHG